LWSQANSSIGRGELPILLVRERGSASPVEASQTDALPTRRDYIDAVVARPAATVIGIMHVEYSR